jgi:hypothetical protein
MVFEQIPTCGNSPEYRRADVVTMRYLEPGTHLEHEAAIASTGASDDAELPRRSTLPGLFNIEREAAFLAAPRRIGDNLTNSARSVERA